MNYKKYFKVIFVLIFLSSIGCASMGMQTKDLNELKKKYANDKSHFVTINNDVTIHYRDEGNKNKPVLLLIHGVCSSLHTWDGWVKNLKDDFRIIRIDVPAFGLTGPLKSGNYNPPYYIELLELTRQKIGIEKFSIAGNSLGGYIAWKYAAKYPQHVEKLILIDSVGFPQDMPLLLSFSTCFCVKPFAKIAMPKFVISKAVHEVYGDPNKVTDEVVERYFDLSQREGNRSAYIEVFSGIKEYSKKDDLASDLIKIKKPILVMWGSKDIWIPYKTEFPKWKKNLPNAKFIVYEGAGHIPMEELPEITAKDALEFLKSK